MTRAGGRASHAAPAEQTAPVFAALGDATRLALVAQLVQRGPLSIAQLADGRAMTRQAITKHLHVLERAGVARRDRHGRECRWACAPGPLNHARRYLAAVSARWDARLDRLRQFVEQ